jgi:hypothetical protein
MTTYTAPGAAEQGEADEVSEANVELAALVVLADEESGA